MNKDAAPAQLITTRPAGDSRALAALLAELPLQVCMLPASEPQLRPWQGALAAALVSPADLYFFPSRHAVGVLQHIPEEQRQWWRCACPGHGTARALRALGVREIICPAEEHTTEALLAMPELRMQAGQRVLVLAAPGGRTLLAQALQQRGALVETVMVYDRVEPEPPADTLQHLQTQHGALLSLVTSSQGLRYLHRVFSASLWQRVAAGTMLLPSQRVAEQAADFGVVNSVVIAPPENARIAAYIRTNFDTLTMQR
ncbi:MAG: uroporphyrinogen-III synthase [Xanthomonadales bacterium]|nr:uroporphyrinogen-III synthase [Xanthomonadales bacterium]